MSYPICGHLNHTGRYILHPKEMKFIPQIKKKGVRICVEEFNLFRFCCRSVSLSTGSL